MMRRRILPIHKETITNLAYFAYLFLIDSLSLLDNRHYADYAKSEPGYGEALFNAYVKTFSVETKGLMTHQLIQTIHKLATAHLPAAMPGCYKNIHSFYGIRLPITYDKETPHINLGYNATKEGIKEFIHYWITEKNSPIVIMFHARNVPFGCQMKTYFLQYNGHFISTTSANKKLGSKITIIDEDLTSLFALLDNHFYSCKILPRDEEINFKKDLYNAELPSEHKLFSYITQTMDSIINEYNHTIVDAKTDDEKILIIAKYVQRIIQLHPFVDGNTRMAYLLLNKLLHDNGLSFTLLLNPNRLDCTDLTHLVSLIKGGQVLFKQLFSKQTSLNFQTLEPKEFPQQLTVQQQALTDIDPSLVFAFANILRENHDRSCRMNHSSNFFTRHTSSQNTDQKTKYKPVGARL